MTLNVLGFNLLNIGIAALLLFGTLGFLYLVFRKRSHEA